MSQPRFGWVGVHHEGVPALEALLEAGAPIPAVFTLSPERAARRSGAADYAPVCRRFGVPLHYVDDINDPATVALLGELDLDVLFVIGWSQILREPALRCARLGVVGAHASMLPANRGSAPINWAILRGERQTGNSLLWLADDVDAGAVIDQLPIPITPYDTCASLYQQVAETNRTMLLRLLPRLLAGEHPGTNQPADGAPVLPRRRPADGVIDWSSPGEAVYDFVRALTRPYPGAFGFLGGRRATVWQTAALPPLPGQSLGGPGDCLGPVVSPVDSACGQLVACGEGAVILLEVEMEDGTVLAGRALSQEPWSGRTWSRA